MARNIRALKGTVGAQEKTIRAQSQIYSEIQGLLSTMRTVVKSTDEPKILERLKAYEQFVEKEKEAAMVLLGKWLGQQYELSVKNLSSYIDEFFGAILSLLPFIPMIWRSSRSKKRCNGSRLGCGTVQSAGSGTLSALN